MDGLNITKTLYSDPPPKREPDILNKNEKQNIKTMKNAYAVYQNSPFKRLFTGGAKEVKNFINSHAEAEKKNFEIYKMTFAEEKDEKLSVTDFLVQATKAGE